MKVTWLAPVSTTLLSTDQFALRSSAGYFFNRLKVNTTSLALKGCPSDQVTPLRMVNVRAVLALVHAHDVANQGFTAPWLIESTYANSS